MPITEKELRRLISSYVAAQTAFEDFNVEFSVCASNLEEDEPVASIIDKADLLVAEFTSGHRDEQDLKRALLQILGGRLDVELAAAQAPAIFTARPFRGRASNALRREAVPA
jgi:hypothetical protein